MYNGSTILLCVTIFVVHMQCLIRAHCSIVPVTITIVYKGVEATAALGESQ
jgi:hypothetical protein